MDLSREKILKLVCPNLLPYMLEFCPENGLGQWEQTGRQGHCLWGIYRVADEEERHEVVVRTDDFRFRCKCADGSVLCPHAFNLLLLGVDAPRRFPENSAPPHWAKTVIEQWDKAGGRIASQGLKPWNNRLQGKRLQQMSDGLALLELWLQDLLRQGLLTLENNPDSINHIARRMVDHKLGTIGRRLRRWVSYLQQPDWPPILLDEIGLLYLTIQAMRKLENLPQDLPEDLLTMMGVSIRRNDLLAEPQRVCGRYVCTGVMVKEEESNMQSIWSWLINLDEHAYTLLLDFEVNGVAAQRYPISLGEVHDLELVYYPSVLPQRAVVRRGFLAKSSDERHALPRGFPTLSSFAQEHARLVATVPWRSQVPALLDAVVPVLDGDGLYVVDKDRYRLPLQIEKAAWQELCSLSGGKPLTLFVVWNGRSLSALSAWVEGQCHALTPKKDRESSSPRLEWF